MTRLARRLLLIIVLVATACGQHPREAAQTPMPAQPLFQIEKISSIRLGGVKHVLEKGILRVPENRQRATSRWLQLPLYRIRTRSALPGEPIFWLNGGPGASNLGFKPPAGLLAKHDVVMLGYRGVDGESRLDSREIKIALQGDGRDLLSGESSARLKRALKVCSQRLQQSGVDLNGYTIPEVIADLESARSAFGYEKIQLLSASYGTRVALLFAQAYPQHVSRSCLLGANPPGHFLWRPEVVDQQLTYYSDLYAKAYPNAAGTLAEMMQRVNQNLPQRWLGFRIDPGQVRVLTFLMLFHRGSAAAVFNTYQAADRGDNSGLFFMSLVGNFLLPRILNWADLFSKGMIDFDPALNYEQLLAPEKTLIGSPLSRLIWENANAWPMTPLPAAWKVLRPSSVPTLIISGSVDFSTPAEFASSELLPLLTNGHQIILSEMGHVEDLLTLQPRALEQLFCEFFNDGKIAAAAFKPMPMNFRVALGFPLLAKVLFILISVLVVLGMVLVGWFVVFLRKR